MKFAYRAYLQDRKKPSFSSDLKNQYQLAKTFKMKDKGDLRGAYSQLKVTLRTVNISWFERGRKSVGPRNRISAEITVNSSKLEQLQEMTA